VILWRAPEEPLIKGQSCLIRAANSIFRKDRLANISSYPGTASVKPSKSEYSWGLGKSGRGRSRCVMVDLHRYRSSGIQCLENM
jgi:hypothetical protein